MKVGIIAEDHSDVAVLRELTLSLLKPHEVRFKPFVGNGCGKLRRKCAAWARNLVQQECRWIVVVHDLDVNDERELRGDLEQAIAPAGAQHTVVLIPRKEIEAWLLYDADAIARAFRERQRLPLPGNPESIPDPKKHLRELIWRRYRKQYLNSVHNSQIAKYIRPRRLRAPSFAPHFAFTTRVKNTLQRSQS